MGIGGIRLAATHPTQVHPMLIISDTLSTYSQPQKPGALCERFCTRDVADLIGEADAESKEETTHNEHG